MIIPVFAFGPNSQEDFQGKSLFFSIKSPQPLKITRFIKEQLILVDI